VTVAFSDIRKPYEPFTLFLHDVSYYSGKMEMYLRYKGVPFKRKTLCAADNYNILYKNTGVMKVPAISAANGEWLRDTTPMIDWFEKLYPESSVMPDEPALHFISKLIEDYADEWLWRPAMYYRWWYDKDNLGQRIARDAMHDLPFPKWLSAKIIIRRQTNLFMKKDGITSRTRGHVEETYLKNLNSLQKILSQTPYLLGNRPSLVDYGYMGPMFRHFFCDPTPSGIMIEKAPAVYSWVARMWNARACNHDQTSKLKGFSSAGWHLVLKDICMTYLPFLYANDMAFRKNKKKFDFDAQGVLYRRLPVVKYRVWCRQVLQQLYGQLDQSDKEMVHNILQKAGGLAALTKEGPTKSGLDSHYRLPLRYKKRRPNLFWKTILKIKGTPWDIPDSELKS